MSKLIVALIFLVFGSWGELCIGAVTPKAPALDYDMSQEEIEVSRTRAVGGDAQSSRRLADYSIFVGSDEHEYAFWLRLSAEQGNCDSIFRYLQWHENRPSASAEWGGGELVRRLHLKKKSCEEK